MLLLLFKCFPFWTHCWMKANREVLLALITVHWWQVLASFSYDLYPSRFLLFISTQYVAWPVCLICNSTDVCVYVCVRVCKGFEWIRELVTSCSKCLRHTVAASDNCYYSLQLLSVFTQRQQTKLSPCVFSVSCKKIRSAALACALCACVYRWRKSCWFAQCQHIQKNKPGVCAWASFDLNLVVCVCVRGKKIIGKGCAWDSGENQITQSAD